MSSSINKGHKVVYTDSVPVDITKYHDQESSDQELSSTYNMSYPTGGFALIINNDAGEISSREADSMQKTLQHFRFKVIRRNNLKVCDTKQIFTDVCKLNHSKSDCFICVILTEGPHPDIIQCTDKTVSLVELMNLFSPKVCETLAHKPKLFFIQNANCIYNSQLNGDHRMPMMSLSEDFLIASCTVNSERKDQGFINILSCILKDFGHTTELQHLLMRVNNKIAAISKNNGLKGLNNVPFILSTLTKQLTFSEKT